MKIRYLSSADDKAAISKIYEESWKHVYQGIIPQTYLDSVPEGQWASNLDNPNLKTLVCVEDGRLIGTSSFGKSRMEKYDRWGEIISIYLLPDYMRKGYGKALLQAAVSELKKLGFEDVFLWVLEENIRARRFYERFGFWETDDYLEDCIGGKDLREIRYIRMEKDRGGTVAYQ